MVEESLEQSQPDTQMSDTSRGTFPSPFQNSPQGSRGSNTPSDGKPQHSSHRLHSRGHASETSNGFLDPVAARVRDAQRHIVDYLLQVRFEAVAENLDS